MENMTIASKLKNIQPDFDKKESYQHGFHDGVGVAIDMIETASGSVAAPKPKTEGRWFKDWKKITEAVIPKGPMCRDCADEDGTCPNNDGLPCDPTDEVIERFKRLRQQLKEREEVIKELLPMAEWKLQSTSDYLAAFSETIETEPEKYKECDRLKAIIERARKLLSK